MTETPTDGALPLLLLPGMMCDARLFAPQIAALAPDRPVTVPDLTGQDTMAALAAAVLATAPERFALAGLSMGGIVAMEVIRQAPGRVARLALLDTNPRAELPEVQARRAPHVVGSSTQVMAVPAQPPSPQASPKVQSSPSSQGPVRGVCTQAAPSSQLSVVHWSASSQEVASAQPLQVSSSVHSSERHWRSSAHFAPPTFRGWHVRPSHQARGPQSSGGPAVQVAPHTWA